MSRACRSVKAAQPAAQTAATQVEMVSGVVLGGPSLYVHLAACKRRGPLCAATCAQRALKPAKSACSSPVQALSCTCPHPVWRPLLSAQQRPALLAPALNAAATACTHCAVPAANRVHEMGGKGTAAAAHAAAPTCMVQAICLLTPCARALPFPDAQSASPQADSMTRTAIKSFTWRVVSTVTTITLALVGEHWRRINIAHMHLQKS